VLSGGLAPRSQHLLFHRQRDGARKRVRRRRRLARAAVNLVGFPFNLLPPQQAAVYSALFTFLPIHLSLERLRPRYLVMERAELLASGITGGAMHLRRPRPGRPRKSPPFFDAADNVAKAIAVTKAKG
jgi:hypothetical protein